MTASATILDLHRALRRFGCLLPGEAQRAAAALLEVGQSGGTWTWPRETGDPRGYSRRHLGRLAGGVGPEVIRRGLRILEGLGLVRTQARPWTTSRYSLQPEAWVDLGRAAEQDPAPVLARVRHWLAEEDRGTVRRLLARMLQRIERCPWTSMATSPPARPVTPSGQAPASGTPTWPAWVEAWASRHRVSPAAAWAAVEPGLAVLRPGQPAASLGGLGQLVLGRWQGRGRPSGVELAAELGLVLKAVRGGAPGTQAVARRMARGGVEALVRSSAWDSLVAAAQAWQAEASAPALPTGAAAAPVREGWTQALAMARERLGFAGVQDEDLDMDQLVEIDELARRILAEAGPAPPD